MKVGTWLKKLSFAAVTTAMLATMVLVPALPAMAVLTVGPIDPLSQFQGNPNSGFAMWYQDQQGTKVTLRNALGNYPVDAASLGDGTDGSAYANQLGFTNEAFYYMAAPDIDPAVGIVEFAVEAVFLAPATVGQESVMTRTRIRLETPAATGSVTVTSPYGTRVLPVTQVRTQGGLPVFGINFTEDIGAIPRDFATAATGSSITNFIRPVTPPAGATLLGDGISVGPATVGIGGPAAVVTITGAGLNITTNQWTIAGHLFPNVAPVASFTKAAPANVPAVPATVHGTPITVSQGVPVNFADTSINGPSGWSWNFGDAGTSTVQNPTHIYNSVGAFTVNMTASNPAGSSTALGAVNVVAGTAAVPVANFAFTMDPTNAEVPLTVTFTDLSTGIPTQWLWNFGDGSVEDTNPATPPTHTIPNPVHTYTTPGTFTVTLLVSNAVGANSAAKILTALPPTPFPPIASFVATPATGEAPLTVAFTDTTRGVPTAWSWNFGDAASGAQNTSTLQNPTHTFATLGNFPVTLTASNALGVASASQVVTVVVLVPPAPVLSVALTAFNPGSAGPPVVPASGSLTFTWPNPPAGATITDYVLEHDPAGTAFPPGAVHQHVIPATARTFIHPLDGGEIASMTPPNDTTNFRLVARNAGVRSAPSNVLHPIIAVPAAPAAPVAAVTSNTSVRLNWVDPVGATQIRIERSTGGGAFAQITGSPVNAGVRTITDTGLTANTTYQYQLLAINIVGPGAASAPVTVLTAGPASPTSPAATSTAVNQARVTWVDPAGPTQIIVERATGTTGAFAAVAGSPVNAGVQLLVDNTAVSGTTYVYRVTAVNGAGQSAPAMTGPVTVPAPFTGGGGFGGGGFGGGGGGGGAPATTTVSLTGLSGSLSINSSGAASSAATLTNSASTVSLSIPSGSVLKTSGGSNLSTMTVSTPATVPAAPSGKVIIMAQDFGPDGATFNPAITLTLSYNEANLPTGVAESSLVLVKWNGSAWVDVAGSTVNAAANTVSASISGFSMYGISGTQLQQPQPTTTPPTTTPPTTRPPTTTPAARPTVTITAPTAGSSVQPGSVTVRINTSNFQIVPPGQTSVPGQGHVHYYLDVATIPTTPGQPAVSAAGTYKAVADTSAVWDNVAPGTHTFGVQLVNINHTPFDPPVTATVTVTVAAPTTPPATTTQPSPGASGGGANWGLIIGIIAAVIVVAVIIFLVVRRKPAAT